MEQHVGLKTFTENLRRVIDRDPRIRATWAYITYHEQGGVVERFLAFLPQALRGRLRGFLQVRRALRMPADARFYLTQVPAALGGRDARALPYVTMTDVTPVQYDSMADGYGHVPDRNPLLKRWKHRVNQAVFQDAAAVLSISKWTADSVMADYGVRAERSIVLAPGVDLAQWQRKGDPPRGVCRILFVGAEFPRKGGFDLLAAFRALPAGAAELHVVTTYDLPAEPGVTVHRGLKANSPDLITLFHSCHFLVLPSLAEAFGQVIVEALASGLPCVVTEVGAMPGIIVPGETGLVVAPHDPEALVHALRTLVDDSQRVSEMSRRASERAAKIYDASANGTRVVDLLVSAVDEGTARA